MDGQLCSQYDDPDFDPDLARVEHLLDTLMVGLTVQTAAIDTQYAILRCIAKQLGLTELDGLPLEEWYQKSKFERVEKTLLETEERSPGLAARLQTIWDEHGLRKTQQPPPGDPQA